MDFNTPTAVAGGATTTIYTGLTKLFSIVVPIALDNTVTVQSSASVTYFVLPALSIGTFEFEAMLPNGLKIVNASGQGVIINAHQ